MNSRKNLDFADKGVDIEQSLSDVIKIPLSSNAPFVHGDLSEDRIGLLFSEQYSEKLKFCHSAGKWYFWTGFYWEQKTPRYAQSHIRPFIRHLTGGRREYCRAAKIAAVEQLLKESAEHSVQAKYWDRDIYLLGTPDWAIDLRDGAWLQPDPDYAITKKTSVSPLAGRPLTWLQFLDDATRGDTEVIRYIQQICGYALTGSTKENALFFIYGPGGNGKSVFLNTVAGILGDYARAASMETFTASKQERHPTEIAMLQGRRLVTANETEEGKSWAEARIKQLTGSDPISARYMKQDFFEFVPQFKLIIVGNHAPQLRTVDDAIRRRFNFLPFIHKPTSPDRNLEAKLRHEWPQILNWMIEGCIDWQINGFVRPITVTQATDTYFEEQDLFTQWLEESCECRQGCREQAATLFQDWTKYAESRGEQAGTMKTFCDTLKHKGFDSTKSGGIRWRLGIQLMPGLRNYS